MKSEIVYVIDNDDVWRKYLKDIFALEAYTVLCFKSAEEYLSKSIFNLPNTVSCFLMDMDLPGMSGLKLQEKLLDTGVVSPVAFLTNNTSVKNAVEAIKLGAIEYSQKPRAQKEILDIAQTLIKSAHDIHEYHVKKKRLKLLIDKLTPRELEVLELIMVGKGNREISLELGISIQTTGQHKARVLDKFNVGNIFELVRFINDHQWKSNNLGTSTAVLSPNRANNPLMYLSIQQ